MTLLKSVAISVLYVVGISAIASSAYAQNVSIVSSNSANRSASSSLNGQTVDEDIYVSLMTGVEVSRVRFFVDGNLVNTELHSPFDLQGGASDEANPFDTNDLSNGNHIIRADILFDNGSTDSISANFAVANTTLPEPVSTFRHRVTFEGESVDITFSPFSSRGPLFSVHQQTSNGDIVEVDDVPDVKTYIGLVDNHPEAFASALVRESGEVFATVVFPITRTWRDEGGLVTEQTRENTPLLPTQFLTQTAGSDLYAADVFIDLAKPYIDEAGGTVIEALETVEYSMTAINAIYMRDNAIINRIGKVIMRTTASQDPYRGNTADHRLILLGLSSTERTDHDIVTVISGAIGGGIADVGTISRASSANGTNGSGYFVNPARHEFGHNWGSAHFEGGAHNEGRTIMSGNGLSKFASAAMEDILNERYQVADEHLENLGNVAPQLPPRAGDDLATVSLNSSIDIFPLDNDNDVNGESISLLSVPAETFAGNTLTVSDQNTVTLQATVNTSDGYDWFRYSMQDESGLISEAVVHIRLE